MSHFGGQFSENLVLPIYEFLFNFGNRISKEKKLWKFSELKILKNGKNTTKILNLLIVFLINTLLFVRIEQKSKTEVRKQPFKCVP